MNIRKISILRYERKFVIPFKSSHAERNDPESVIVRIDCDNGVTGFGESTPRPYVTGETCATVIDCVRDVLAPPLIGASVDSMPGIEALLDDLDDRCRVRADAPYNSALGAIDIALIDALGKSQGISASDCLGPAVRDSIDYSITVPFMSSRSIEKLFHQFKGADFRFLKIIIGPSLQENDARVGLIRSLMGWQVDLRLEANGLVDPDAVLANLRSLEKYGISAIEQPAARGDLAAMARFTSMTDVPVVADESLCTMDDLRALVRHRACDIVNIKLSKCGGLIRSQKIASLARSEGLACQMGAHVGETSILSEAGRAFAMTTPDLRYVEGCSFLLFQTMLQEKQMNHRGPAFGEGLGLGHGEESVLLNDSSPMGVVGP